MYEFACWFSSFDVSLGRLVYRLLFLLISGSDFNCVFHDSFVLFYCVIIEDKDECLLVTQSHDDSLCSHSV